MARSNVKIFPQPLPSTAISDLEKNSLDRDNLAVTADHDRQLQSQGTGLSVTATSGPYLSPFSHTPFLNNGRAILRGNPSVTAELDDQRSISTNSLGDTIASPGLTQVSSKERLDLSSSLQKTGRHFQLEADLIGRSSGQRSDPPSRRQPNTTPSQAPRQSNFVTSNPSHNFDQSQTTPPSSNAFASSAFVGGLFAAVNRSDWNSAQVDSSSRFSSSGSTSTIETGLAPLSSHQRFGYCFDPEPSRCSHRISQDHLRTRSELSHGNLIRSDSAQTLIPLQDNPQSQQSLSPSRDSKRKSEADKYRAFASTITSPVVKAVSYQWSENKIQSQLPQSKSDVDNKLPREAQNDKEEATSLWRHFPIVVVSDARQEHFTSFDNSDWPRSDSHNSPNRFKGRALHAQCRKMDSENQGFHQTASTSSPSQQRDSFLLPSDPISNLNNHHSPMTLFEHLLSSTPIHSQFGEHNQTQSTKSTQSNSVNLMSTSLFDQEFPFSHVASHLDTHQTSLPRQLHSSNASMDKQTAYDALTVDGIFVRHAERLDGFIDPYEEYLGEEHQLLGSNQVGHDNENSIMVSSFDAIGSNDDPRTSNNGSLAGNFASNWDQSPLTQTSNVQPWTGAAFGSYSATADSGLLSTDDPFDFSNVPIAPISPLFEIPSLLPRRYQETLSQATSLGTPSLSSQLDSPYAPFINPMSGNLNAGNSIVSPGPDTSYSSFINPASGNLNMMSSNNVGISGDFLGISSSQVTSSGLTHPTQPTTFFNNDWRFPQSPGNTSIGDDLFDDSLSSSSRPRNRRHGDASHNDARDHLLVELKNQGLSYKEIRARGNFTEAESTLRGRYRTLTKPKEERVRKPEWTEQDVSLPSPTQATVC